MATRTVRDMASVSDAFGFHVPSASSLPARYCGVNSALVVASWIPVVGAISGIARLIIGGYMYAKAKDEHAQRSYSITMMARGAVESLSFGYVFIVFDILATSYRQHKFKDSHFHRFINFIKKPRTT